MSLRKLTEREQILRETKHYERYYRDSEWVQCTLGFGECTHTVCVLHSRKKERPIENEPSQRFQSLENSVKYLLEKEYSRKKKPARSKKNPTEEELKSIYNIKE